VTKAGTLRYDLRGYRHPESNVMARKQAERKAEMIATDEKLRAVRLELPEDVHKLLRLEAAKQDTSLAALARIAVEEYLVKRKTGAK
jgi:predicted HicB family RNase H-like nuclease